MALFKVFKGVKSSLPSLSSSQDGYCYFTTDDGMFYIDYKNTNGVLERKALNSSDAKTLLGAQLETVLTENDKKIPTSKAVLTKIGEVEASIVEIDSKLDDKADLESPAFRGMPTAPTAAAGTSTTQIATTEFVTQAVEQAFDNGANIATPYEVTLLASGWVGEEVPYIYNITFDGHNNTTDFVNLNIGDITIEQMNALSAANIVRGEWTTNTNLAIYAYGTKPEIDIPVIFYVESYTGNVDFESMIQAKIEEAMMPSIAASY